MNSMGFWFFVICIGTIVTADPVPSCDNSVSAYSSAKKQCVGLVGKDCINDHCVDNSDCMDLCDNYDPVSNNRTGPGTWRVREDVCWKECTCFEWAGFVKSESGLCLAPVGSSCQNSDTCITGLECTSGKCSCNEKTSVFSETTEQCKGRVSHPCVNEQCVTNAECLDLCDIYDPISNNRSGPGTWRVSEDVCWKECICSEGNGFKTTKDGLCQSPLGVTCDNSDTCISGMKCIEGKCACDKETTEWDSIKGRCVGLANQLCVDNEHCVQNAECQYLCDNFDPKTNQTTEEDICIYQCLCPADYLASPPVQFTKSKGHCQAHQGGPCGNSNEHCLSGMVCQEGKCKCPLGSHQYYDTTKNTCITYPGGPCVPGDHYSCVPHAYCSPMSTNSTSWHCECGEIFVENEDGKCLIPLDYGENCPSSEARLTGTCDPRSNLVCSNGKCGCKNELQVYNKETKKCEGLVGARCSPEKEVSSCTAGAFCSTKTALRGTRLAKDKKGICQCKEETEVLKDRRCPV